MDIRVKTIKNTIKVHTTKPEIKVSTTKNYIQARLVIQTIQAKINKSQIKVSMKEPIKVIYVVNTIDDRDLIPMKSRYDGMIVYVKSENNNYQLRGGIDNTNRSEFTKEETDPIFTAWLETNPLGYYLDKAIYDPAGGNKQVAFEEDLQEVIDGIEELQDITKEPTGFTDPENVVVTYNNDRTVTLTGNVEAYYKGKKIPELVSGWTSQPHADTNGVFFLHYCDGNFIFDTTPWTFDCLQIAFVQNNGYKIGIRECHGLMQRQSHKEFHETIGTYRSAGGDFSGFTLNSSVVANRRPDIAALTVYDEDLKSIIPLLNSKKYTHRYLSGSGARTFDIQQNDIVKQNGTVPRYNIFSGGVWSFADIPTSQYAAIFVVGIPATADSGSQEYRYMFVQPQQYGTLEQIQALTPNSLNHGDTATLVSEFVFFGKIIIQSLGGNWQIKSVELLTGTRVNQVSTSGNFLSVVNTDASLTGNGTAASPLSVVQNYIKLDQTTPQTITKSPDFQCDITAQGLINRQGFTITKDGNGNLSKITYDNGREITYTRDGNGNISYWSDGTYKRTVNRDVNGDITGISFTTL